MILCIRFLDGSHWSSCQNQKASRLDFCIAQSAWAWKYSITGCKHICHKIMKAADIPEKMLHLKVNYQFDGTSRFRLISERLWFCWSLMIGKITCYNKVDKNENWGLMWCPLLGCFPIFFSFWKKIDVYTVSFK